MVLFYDIKTPLLHSCRSEGRSKSVWRQLRINTLWQWRGYHEIMVLFILSKLLLQKRMCSHPVARYLMFGPTLSLLPFFMCVNSEGSGETERMHRLAWAFAGCLCDKYHDLMSWLIYSLIWRAGEAEDPTSNTWLVNHSPLAASFWSTLFTQTCLFKYLESLW